MNSMKDTHTYFCKRANWYFGITKKENLLAS